MSGVDINHIETGDGIHTGGIVEVPSGLFGERTMEETMPPHRFSNVTSAATAAAVGKLTLEQERNIRTSYAQRMRETLVRKFLKFLPDAEAARGRSKDRSTKVGAVVLDDDFNLRISGYNGFPRGVNDDVDVRHERPAKYDWSAHAEENCVAQAARTGTSLNGCTILLTSLFPCTGCSRMIIQSGIKRVIAPGKKDAGDGAETRMDWSEKEILALEMLAEAGVEVLYY